MDASLSHHYLLALRLVADPYVLAVILGSAVYGLFVGCIPGLTATLAVSLLVPITFFMPPVPAVAAIVTVGADLNLTHRADSILTRGWMPTA